MNWPSFQHEAMATRFEIMVSGRDHEYARQAAAEAFRLLDRIESELSRFVESSDIARGNRLARGESCAIGEHALRCLLLAAELTVATGHAFDVSYASQRAAGQASDGPAYQLDLDGHRLISQVTRLQLDLGAIGKGYALDEMARLLREWNVARACLSAGTSTVVALDPPEGQAGWPVSVGGEILELANFALSGSGLAVQGRHIVDPRVGETAGRRESVWSAADSGAVSDALSTAAFVMNDDEIMALVQAHPEIGVAYLTEAGGLKRLGWFEARS